MESFFASLKKEHVHHVRFRTRAEARAAVFEYVEIFYNRQRLHSALGYRPRPRRGPAWKGSTCARPRDVLIPPLHSSGGGPRCQDGTVQVGPDKAGLAQIGDVRMLAAPSVPGLDPLLQDRRCSSFAMRHASCRPARRYPSARRHLASAQERGCAGTASQRCPRAREPGRGAGNGPTLGVLALSACTLRPTGWRPSPRPPLTGVGIQP